jgi:hypothetical protein
MNAVLTSPHAALVFRSAVPILAADRRWITSTRSIKIGKQNKERRFFSAFPLWCQENQANAPARN